MFLGKSVQKRFHFVLRGKKNTSILCLLALCLIVPLTVLHASKPQSLQAATPPGVTVDFGSRLNTTHPIPPNLLGISGIGIGVALNHDGSAVPQANLRFTKLG